MVEEGSVTTLPQAAPISSLPCRWERAGRALDHHRMLPLANGSLYLMSVKIDDEGIYTCHLQSQSAKTAQSVFFQLAVYGES